MVQQTETEQLVPHLLLDLGYLHLEVVMVVLQMVLVCSLVVEVVEVLELVAVEVQALLLLEEALQLLLEQTEFLDRVVDVL